jgi:dihydrolipoamide dehydrogenase
LELGTIYSALGSNITLVELSDGLMPGADRDLVAPLEKRLRAKFKHIYTNTKVTRVIEEDSGLLVSLAGDDCPQQPVKFDKILLSVGRVPNGNTIDADKAGVKVDERGFIPVDNTMRTNISHIYAVGDVVGIPMLAHKSIPQGKVAAENIVGKKHFFDPKAIASVAYTDPEVAWVGLSESQAKEQGIAYEKGVFPWAASGRALASWRSEGMTKVLFDKVTKRIVGAGIVGPHAGDLICEAALAIEMGCDGEDIALTIHPHPTLGETLALATEMYEGSITDLIAPKK